MRHSKAWCGTLLGFLLLSPFGGDLGSKGQAIKPELGPTLPSQNLQVNREFGKMPVYFIPNRGQVDEQVAYYVQGKDKAVYFADEGVTFILAKAKKRSEDLDNKKIARMPRSAKEKDLLRLHSWEGSEGIGDARANREEEISERWVVKLDFVGPNPDTHPEGLDETGTKISYFKGRPEEWKTGLPAYSKVMYKDLWPGIDLVYYGTVNRLKYDFIVHPGADPAQIRLAYRGAESVSIDEEGRLQVTTPMGGFSDDVPIAYQEIGGKRTDVHLAYRVDGELLDRSGERIAGPENVDKDGENSWTRSCSYGFEIGDYNASLPLVLDPAILIYCGYVIYTTWSYITYKGYGIALDSSGNAYITGYIDHLSTDPYAFVSKANASGTAISYRIHIGGVGNDFGNSIAVDSSGNAFITGYTYAGESTFPVSVGPDLTHNGEADAFVAKVNASGTGLLYCGYIGGLDDDYGNGIALDSSGNAYIAGHTYSTQNTFPVSLGPDLTHNGGSDAFVAKVNASGTGLLYCGYVGGLAYDSGSSIALDSSGNAFISGMTASNELSFPVIVGPDLTHNGDRDAFIAKVNNTGTALSYCGYTGGIDYDSGHDIAVDISGNAYITGETDSNELSFPVMLGSDLTHNGLRDAFIAKVNASGTALSYCGYIGGLGYDSGYGIAVDSSGNAYITGETDSDENSFPVTMGPDLSYNGAIDAFVAKINASGIALSYCGYVGGLDYDSGYGIAVDSSGYAYVTGETDSDESSFPVTVGPVLTHCHTDAFVAKISPEYFGFYIFDGQDFDGDSTSDLSVFRPSSGLWFIRGSEGGKWGEGNDIPVPGDYNGDGKTDIAVWRPSEGIWYLQGIRNDKWGQLADVPVPADYDGDQTTDMVVWRPSNGVWYISGIGNVQWGQQGDYPVPADYDGDGIDEVAVWRPADGGWFIFGGGYRQWGTQGDIPVPADYNGDGITDIAVYRPSNGTWHILYSGDGTAAVPWGTEADTPVPGDYDGDGTTEIAVWRPLNGLWYILGGTTIQHGQIGDIPLTR
jgi:hypothetical protein